MVVRHAGTPGELKGPRGNGKKSIRTWNYSRKNLMNKTQVHIDDEDRYSRLKLIGWWDQQRLRDAKIMVVGAGALGNEVLKNLALIGIGHVRLIDFDVIENSNLSRSVLFRADDAGKRKAEVASIAARELNPDVEVEAVCGNVLTDIGLGSVREMDLVIGCLDNREARLWVNRMCWKVGTPWIDGGIQEINGVVKVFMPPDGACYECAMTERDYQLIQLRYSCPLLRREDLQQGKVPTAPTIASIIAGMQVQEALKLLHELPTDVGSALVFNGAANQFYKSKFPYREDCLSHETYEPIISSPLTCENTLLEVDTWLQAQMGVGAERLLLDRDFVTTVECPVCQTEVDVNQPLPAVSTANAVCSTCQDPMVPRMLHVVDMDSPLAERKLSELGVPDHDVIQLARDDKTTFVELVKTP